MVLRFRLPEAAARDLKTVLDGCGAGHWMMIVPSGHGEEVDAIVQLNVADVDEKCATRALIAIVMDNDMDARRKRVLAGRLADCAGLPHSEPPVHALITVWGDSEVSCAMFATRKALEQDFKAYVSQRFPGMADEAFAELCEDTMWTSPDGTLFVWSENEILGG